jgi:hypothetical protein
MVGPGVVARQQIDEVGDPYVEAGRVTDLLQHGLAPIGGYRGVFKKAAHIRLLAQQIAEPAQLRIARFCGFRIQHLDEGSGVSIRCD